MTGDRMTADMLPPLSIAAQVAVAHEHARLRVLADLVGTTVEAASVPEGVRFILGGEVVVVVDPEMYRLAAGDPFEMLASTLRAAWEEGR